MTQTSFLSPPPEPVFNIYHDESGTYVPYKGDRWLMHGILFVPEHKQNAMFQSLQSVRNELDYHYEVHFNKLRSYGIKSRIIKKWLNVYLVFSEHCFYYCLAVDTRSPAFQHANFSDPYYVYNYFARTAIVGGIAWALKPYPKVKLRFHSDHKRRPKDDNFAEYIPQAVLESIQEKRIAKPSSYPQITPLNQEVVLIESDPKKVTPALRVESELTQLTDVITASVAQALIATGNQIKTNLGEMVGTWIEDTRKLPWQQEKDLHRRFSLSCFPDEKGGFYRPMLAVTERSQLPLFSED